MTTNKIIDIIKTKEVWQSNELISLIESQTQKEIMIKFCHIGWFEGLLRGTKTTVCESLEDVQEVLIGWEIVFDYSIEDAYELAESVESIWTEYFENNGGGSTGWIEYE